MVQGVVMRVLLVGASGFVGRNIHTALDQLGHQVIPISRRYGVDVRQLLTAAAWLPHLAGVDAVVNALGIIGETRTQRFATLHTAAPVALFQACVLAGVKRVIQISALGAEPAAFSAYHRSKLAADEFLQQLDLAWLVLRPSLIYGRGSRSGDLLLQVARLPYLPVLGDGQQLIQPVHIRDVVACVCQGLIQPLPQMRQCLDIAGSTVFTFAKWLHTLRHAQGLPPTTTVRIPLRMALFAAHFARYIQPIMQPDTLRMLQQGYVVEAPTLARLHQFLGRPPLSPSPELVLCV